MKIKVSERISIGDGEPCFIVAEVGSNWKTLSDCLDSIYLAKACGADAVKFQAFDGPSLYGPFFALTPGQDGVLPLEWLPKLRTHADSAGIEFMCSAFSPELAEAVDPYVNVHKIASAELTHLRLLQKTNSFGKPVILSTGASGEEDVSMALKQLAGCATCLLYCVASYPARSVRLERIEEMRVKFNPHPIGFSDHTTDIFTAPSVAVNHFKAAILEKHVNFIDHLVSPDSPHSLNTKEFKLMIAHIKKRKAFFNEEEEMYLKHNRRLIATRDIDPGDQLIEGENFGIYRSLSKDCHAFSPWLTDEVNNKTAKREIKAGEGIGPGDV